MCSAIGHLEESCKAFREGLVRTPGSTGLLQGLAISLSRRGDHRQVVELLAPAADNAIQFADQHDKGWHLLLELGNTTPSAKNQALQRWRKESTTRKEKSGYSSA